MHERAISLRFLGIILRALRLEVRFPYTMFTLQTSFNPVAGGGGGQYKVLENFIVKRRE